MAPAQISESQFQEKEKEHDIRSSNILAAKAVADMIRTSLGPRGMDKMIARPNGEVLITNDGATIMNELKLTHPAAQMIVELSKAQDVEAGDGTTSVVVVAGALLACCQALFAKGIHPSIISDGFKLAVAESMKILQDIAIPVDLSDRDSLIQAASTSLNSKVVSQYSSLLAPLAVDAVLQVIDPATATNVELKDIRITTKLGGVIDDTKLVQGLIFSQGAVHRAQGPARVEKAKVGLIQFCLSSPKSNMDNQVVLNDYTKMDRFINEERRYLLNLCRKIKKTGCNVLLIQKSILRDAVNDISLKFLAEMKIMVIKDVERSDINFICKTINCQPAASIETFTADKLGTAELVEEEGTSGGKVVLMTGVPASKTVSVLCRGSNKLVIAESERSVHDALCVVRSLVKSKFMIAGGGAPEIELSLRLTEYAKTVDGLQTHCIKAFANALEIIPYTLAENAGLSPISIVTELRNRHAKHGEIRAGINVRKGAITDILEENVLQPLLVTQSCLQLATETVCMILKIDDILSCR